MKILTAIAASALATVTLTSVTFADNGAPAPAIPPASAHASAPVAAPAPAVAPAPAAAAASALAPAPAGAVALPLDPVATLSSENALLKEKIKSLQAGSVTPADLTVKNCKRLKDIAADIRAQRQQLGDFEGYVKWMSTNVAGYSKYLSASSVAAGFAKALPIPYAGQASVFTKFVANAALSLSAASVSIDKYLGTSQQFLFRTDNLDPSEANPAEVSELVRFADQQLLKEMVDVQERLTSTCELTASSLSFLESINHYLGATDEYWAKTRSLMKSGDEKKEKGFITESVTTLRTKAQTFTAKFRVFDDAIKKDGPLIKSLVNYDDLIQEMNQRVAENKKP